MYLSPEGAAFLRRHEGFVGHAYSDPVGILTIGIGFTWGSSAFRTWWRANKGNAPFGAGAKMTRAEADAALIFICAEEYGRAVNEFLERKVAQHVFDGTCSPVYNMGPGSLKWQWASAVKAGDLALAAKRLINTGTTAKGKKLPGLVRRRKEEAELIEHGNYSGVAVEADAMADGMLVRGERGSAVVDLQKALAATGHYDGVVDGIFGYGTEAAVLAFQRANGLKPDGYAGPKTLAALSIPPAPEKPASEPRNWIAAIIELVVGVFARLWKK